jgi:formylmethanofuran dehydrogenase subunit E
VREPVFEAVDRREREQEKWLEARPVCDVCGEHIQEESYFNINGVKICQCCIDCFVEWID